MITLKRTILVFSFLSFFLGAPLFAAAPESLRLSWQHDPQTTMTISWNTRGNTILPTVEYGATTNYGNTKTGTTATGVANGSYYHTVELTGLAAGALYHFRVRGDEGWGNDDIFRTAPARNDAFSFITLADMGTSSHTNAVTMHASQQDASFALIAGDLAYASGGTARETWETWLRILEKISHAAPVMPALGNHDVESGVKEPSGELFFTKTFALPPENGETYYSFDYSDAHFVALDSNDYNGLKINGAQYQWLENDLRATAKKWKVVYFHHPPYSSSTNHKSERRLQETLGPLFDAHGIDLVITGHDHNYERTYPIRTVNFNEPTVMSTDQSNYTNPGAPIYIVTGGGGRSLYGLQNPKPAWSATGCRCYEFFKVTISGNTLSGVTIGEDGATVDSFSLTKTSAGNAVQPPPLNLPLRGGGENRETVSPPSTMFNVRGFAMPAWWHDTYGKSETIESLRTMKEAGANWVALSPFWYQDSKTSTRMAPHPQKSGTDASLRAVIRAAKNLGIKVMLKPMVDARDGSWRGDFLPSNPSEWFTNYRTFITHYATIAQEEGVDYFVIGTEFVKLTELAHTPSWREIIVGVRALYRGPVTYAANWGTRPGAEYYRLAFWNLLDAIGIDAYPPLVNKNNPTVSELMDGWRPWYRDIEDLHRTHNKPVIFTEIGYLSCDGAVKKPWQWPCGAGVDTQEQADAYEAAVRTWASTPWFSGMFFWRWDPNQNDGGADNTDYVPQKKPAEAVTRRLWTAQAEAQPPSPPSPAPPLPPQVTPGEIGGSVSTISPAIIIRPPSPYAYGLARRSLVIEQKAAQELERELKYHFRGGRIPLAARFWPTYVNAYLYGHYPIPVIARAIRLGGIVVHPAIPFSAWQRSPTYRARIVR